MTRVLVIGGYGGFGGQISRRLAQSGFDVIASGRSMAKAEDFCRSIPECRPAQVDSSKSISGLLAAEQPHLLIDASGPFQSSGYGVIEDCIAAGVSYIDLADSRTFVTGIGRFDGDARRVGVSIVSGASSVPALSGAVVRSLANGMERITSVEIAISASSRAAAGPAVTSAILGGVGQSIELWRGQRFVTRYGWQDLARASIEVRGRSGLGTRLVALVDVPDLALLPGRLPGCPAVTFRAGTESRLAVLALWLASWPVRWGWLGSLAGLSSVFSAAHRLTSLWGGDRSGMAVRLLGLCEGRRIERRWDLVADAGDGPKIPTLAATILAQRIAEGSMPFGAVDAGELLDLKSFETEFKTLAVSHAISERELPPALYRNVLGSAFDRLPSAVRAIHDLLGDSGARGRAQVERGTHPVAKLVAKLMGFPGAGSHELHLHFVQTAGGERWTRDFGGQRFSSTLSGFGDELVERFGPFRFHFALDADRHGLSMEMRRWSFLNVRLPLALAPRSPAREWEEDGKFQFDVPVEMPLIGLVIRYRGWLEPPPAAPAIAANQNGTSSSRSVSNAAGCGRDCWRGPPPPPPENPPPMSSP